VQGFDSCSFFRVFALEPAEKKGQLSILLGFGFFFFFLWLFLFQIWNLGRLLTRKKKRSVPKANKKWMGATFRFLATLFLGALLACIVWEQCKKKWLVKPNIPKVLFDFSLFRSGDLLFFFEHGHISPWPGHVAIVVRLKKYNQLFVWDMPNPLFFGPDLLKPLHMYLQSARKFKSAKLYLQRIQGPALDLIAPVRYASACSHFDLLAGCKHIDFCLRDFLGFPGLQGLLPEVPKKDLYYCTSAVLSILIKQHVVSPSILNDEIVLKPSTFLHPLFDMNKFMLPPFEYLPIEELQV
jgi:Na+-transporting methylmalonyl-CoA/oxaloacetate decarboxylase gamma subunit